jgi:hypothetical protein
MMRAMKLGVFAVAMLAATAGRTQASLIFDFSITNATGNVPGTVTGQILGLTNNTTSAATQVLIDSFPPALGNAAGPTPINAMLWNFQLENSFTVSNGQVTNGGFWAEESSTPLLLLYINGGGGNFNYVSLNGSNTLQVYAASGLAAANIVPAQASPEPASVTLLGLGLLVCAGRRLRRK